MFGRLSAILGLLQVDALGRESRLKPDAPASGAFKLLISSKLQFSLLEIRQLMPAADIVLKLQRLSSTSLVLVLYLPRLGS
jgi:hypothetical protein